MIVDFCLLTENAPGFAILPDGFSSSIINHQFSAICIRSKDSFILIWR